jgi:hypothetical protein
MFGSGLKTALVLTELFVSNQFRVASVVGNREARTSPESFSRLKRLIFPVTQPQFDTEHCENKSERRTCWGGHGKAVKSHGWRRKGHAKQTRQGCLIFSVRQDLPEREG